MKFFLSFVLCCFLQSCAVLDDYLLGKDNTPPPTPLQPIKQSNKFERQWSTTFTKGRDVSAAFKISPVYKEGIVYVAHYSGTSAAVDAQNGKLLWHNYAKNNILSGPALCGDALAFGIEGARAQLVMQKDGALAWNKVLSSDVLAKALCKNSVVIFKTVDDNVYALNKTSGKEQWQYEHGASNLALKTSSSPVLYQNQALVGFSDGKLESLEVDTGRMIWQRSIAFARGASDVERLVDIDANPIVSENTVYIASYQGHIGALSLQSGQFIWKKKASIYKNIVLDQNNIYATDSHDVIWAFDKLDGHVKWKQTALSNRGVTAPAIVGGRLVLGDKGGYLHLLSRASGRFLARTALGSAVYSQPLVVANNIYIATASGDLMRFTVR